MKILLLLTSILLFSSLQSEEKYDLNESKLLDVTLYRNNAELYHEVELNLKSGLNDYYISNVAKTLMQNTIIAGLGKSINGATLYSVEYIYEYFNESDIKDLKDSLNQVIDNIELINLNKNKIALEIAVYEAIPKNIASSNNKFSNIELKNYSSLINSELEILFKDKIKTDNKLKILNELKVELSKKIQEQIILSKKSLIKVTIESDKNIKANLMLNYICDNSGWNPNYDIFLDKIDENAKLHSKADIYQSSGIDWKNVNLTINDGVQSYTSKPNIYPWELYYENRSKMKMATKQVMSVQSRSNESTDMGGYSDRIAFSEIETISNENYSGMEYTLPQKVTIENLTQHKQIKYNLDTLELNVYHLAVPKLDKKAYIIAEIKDFYKHNLKEGEITTYLEGIYKGKTYLSIPEKGLPEISFGVDDNIQIKRENLEKFSESRFLSSKKETKFKYQFLVTNNKNVKIKLKMQDHLPNLKSDDFELEVVNLSKGTKDKQGIVTWEFEIEPKQKAEKLLEFNLKHPEDFIIRD